MTPSQQLCSAQLAVPAADGVLADRRLLITGIGLLVILPMCFPRNLGALAWVSVSAVIGFLFTAIAVVTRSSQVGVSVYWLSRCRVPCIAPAACSQAVASRKQALLARLLRSAGSCKQHTSRKQAAAYWPLNS